MANLGIALGAGVQELNRQQQFGQQKQVQDQQLHLQAVQYNRAQQQFDMTKNSYEEQRAKDQKAAGLMTEIAPIMASDRKAKLNHLGTLYNANDADAGYNDGHSASFEETPTGARATFFSPTGQPAKTQEFSDAQIDREILKSTYGRLAAIDPKYAEKFFSFVQKPHDDAQEHQAKVEEMRTKSGFAIQENDAKYASEARYREPDVNKQFLKLNGAEGEGQQVYRVDSGSQLSLAAGAPSTGKPHLTMMQKAHNLEIEWARQRLAGLNPDEIRKRTSKATDTGRENPLYDSSLAQSVTLAAKRKVGDDQHFDSQFPGQNPTTPNASPQSDDASSRFQTDPGMKNYRMGRQTEQGMEVLDSTGRLVGHYR